MITSTSFGGTIVPVKNRKPVSKKQRLTGRERGRDFRFVDRGHFRIRDGEKNDFSTTGSLRRADHFESLFARNAP